MTVTDDKTERISIKVLFLVVNQSWVFHFLTTLDLHRVFGHSSFSPLSFTTVFYIDPYIRGVRAPYIRERGGGFLQVEIQGKAPLDNKNPLLYFR